jgi:hypothetical protein
MYIDTGVNAMYARKTTISSRINSLILAHHVLPTVPSNTTRQPLEPAVAQLLRRKAHSGAGGNAGSGSTSVFDPQVRFF